MFSLSSLHPSNLCKNYVVHLYSILYRKLFRDRYSEMAIFHTTASDLLVLLCCSYLFTLHYKTHKFFKFVLCKVLLGTHVTHICNYELNSGLFSKYHAFSILCRYKFSTKVEHDIQQRRTQGGFSRYIFLFTHDLYPSHKLIKVRFGMSSIRNKKDTSLTMCHFSWQGLQDDYRTYCGVISY